MTDALETAAGAAVSLAPPETDKRAVTIPATGSFDQMIETWFSLTYLLNNLNRSLGLPDAYPFVLSDKVVKKLEFVHRTIAENRSRGIQ
jgi:hypothetical protein